MLKGKMKIFWIVVLELWEESYGRIWKEIRKISFCGVYLEFWGRDYFVVIGMVECELFVCGDYVYLIFVCVVFDVVIVFF